MPVPSAPIKAISKATAILILPPPAMGELDSCHVQIQAPICLRCQMQLKNIEQKTASCTPYGARLRHVMILPCRSSCFIHFPSFRRNSILQHLVLFLHFGLIRLLASQSSQARQRTLSIQDQLSHLYLQIDSQHIHALHQWLSLFPKVCSPWGSSLRARVRSKVAHRPCCCARTRAIL